MLTMGFFGHSEQVEPAADVKLKLDTLHFRKIDLADFVFVVDVDGYIGRSTSNEITYAVNQNKAVMFLSQVVPGYVEPANDETIMDGLSSAVRPDFIIRAYDQLATRAIGAWIEAACQAQVSREKLDRALDHLYRVQKFQVENPKLVKLPD